MRFAVHQAKLCRDRDACEALCLLLPALAKVLELEPMDDFEADAARYQLKQELIGLNGHVQQETHPLTDWATNAAKLILELSRKKI